MIKDFWQERKDEKKRLKELKKQNKKLPKTREQKAYKIFGVCLAFFLIFGSIFYTCRGGGNIDQFSWEGITGISESMKVKLATYVDRTSLIFSKQLDVIDWNNCKDALVGSGCGGVLLSDQIDISILYEKSVNLTSSMLLNGRNIGALSKKMIEDTTINSKVEIIETKLVYENNNLYLCSLIYLDLTSVLLGEKLPFAYVTTTSVVNILNNNMYCMNSEYKINNFSEEDNAEIIEIIDKNSFISLGYYTNELIARQINDFSEGVNAKVSIDNENLKLE